MKGIIYINGPIGSDFEERGVELVDVITQVQEVSKRNITELRVKIKSPGGYVNVGNDIYDYLVSLKAKYEIVTESVGDVGSIATKLFLAGDKRIMGESHKFFIHNPWTTPQGDANALEAVSKELRKIEKGLRKFYLEHTEVTEEGIKLLMDNETPLTSEQALQFGFATEIKNVVKALAIIKPENKQKDMFNNKLKKFAGKELSAEDRADLLNYLKEEGIDTSFINQEEESDRIANIESSVAQLAELVTNMSEKFSQIDVEATVEEAVKNLKNEIKSGHVPPTGSNQFGVTDNAKVISKQVQEKINKAKERLKIV